MKVCVIIFLLVFAYACKSGKNTEPKTFDDKLLVGEWWLDSSSNSHFLYDRLILLSDGSFYTFSGSDGGSLYLKGKWVNKKLVTLPFNDTLEMDFIDSNRIHIAWWGNTENYYKRQNVDYRANLKMCLQSDSIRSKAIGWWKLTTPANIQLPNHGYCFKFTLNVRDNGEALFYIDHKFDSIVDYSYRATEEGITIHRGCLSADCKMLFDSDNSMKMIINQSSRDTLLLERLTEIR